MNELILKRRVTTSNRIITDKNGAVEREIETMEDWVHPDSTEGRKMRKAQAEREATTPRFIPASPWPQAPVAPYTTPYQWGNNWPIPSPRSEVTARSEAMRQHPAGKGRPVNAQDAYVDHEDSDWCQPVIPGLEFMHQPDPDDATILPFPKGGRDGSPDDAA